MLIAGAKRHAKEVLQLFFQIDKLIDLCFFDDISKNVESHLYNEFKILNTIDSAKEYFKEVDEKFVLGLGNPFLRKKLAEKLINQGGKLSSIISNNSLIGNYNVNLGEGLNIMNNVLISNDVYIGTGSLINAHVCVHHDVFIGEYVEVSPQAVLLGGCNVGNNSSIGSNSTILPNIKIGKNVIVGAGSVVTRDIPDNCIALGVPARISKSINIDYK